MGLSDGPTSIDKQLRCKWTVCKTNTDLCQTQKSTMLNKIVCKFPFNTLDIKASDKTFQIFLYALQLPKGFQEYLCHNIARQNVAMLCDMLFSAYFKQYCSSLHNQKRWGKVKAESRTKLLSWLILSHSKYCTSKIITETKKSEVWENLLCQLFASLELQ